MSKSRPANTDKPAAKKRQRKPRQANSSPDEPLQTPVPEQNEAITPTAPEMEVHHHPQLNHQPKPWKEYLLEGFMIFIAVMMGFIAENIREGITHSEHVQQLTAQLVQDLKSDSIQLGRIYQAEAIIVRRNDTLVTLLRQPLQQLDMKKVQRLITDSHSLWPFHLSGGAMAAIKNELHLKQFSNSEIISRFAAYEAHIELLQTVQNITLQYQRNFLDPFLTAHFTPANMDAAFSRSAVLSGQMRNLTQADLDQLAAQMILVRINSRELVNDNQLLQNDVAGLLQYVNKQYQLEEK